MPPWDWWNDPITYGSLIIIIAGYVTLGIFVRIGGIIIGALWAYWKER